MTVNLITEITTDLQMVWQHIQCGYTAQRQDFHAEIEWSNRRLHHATQNSGQYKTSELFISGIYHLIVWNHSSPWTNKIVEKELWMQELQHFHSFTLVDFICFLHFLSHHFSLKLLLVHTFYFGLICPDFSMISHINWDHYFFF